MLQLLLSRNKALVALLGVLVNVAYAYNVTNPNVYVAAILAAVAVLGVHQVPNL